MEFIQRNSIVVMPKCTLKVIYDEPDNRILECAREFKGDYIVSGDTHILKLKKYCKTKILSSNNFLQEISSQ
jgi:predicted nucleic acid-binding protein